MGTWQFITAQSLVIAVWIVVNAEWLGLGIAWDVFPFLLLNIALSFQAAYAAPLMLVASNRQAARERAAFEAQAHHLDEVARKQQVLVEELIRRLRD